MDAFERGGGVERFGRGKAKEPRGLDHQQRAQALTSSEKRVVHGTQQAIGRAAACFGRQHLFQVSLYQGCSVAQPFGKFRQCLNLCAEISCICPSTWPLFQANRGVSG